MENGSPMLGVAVMAMRWHHARLRRLEAERSYKRADQVSPYSSATLHLRGELAEARRMESRYKRRLSQSCEKASDKPKHSEIIDI